MIVRGIKFVNNFFEGVLADFLEGLNLRRVNENRARFVFSVKNRLDREPVFMR